MRGELGISDTEVFKAIKMGACQGIFEKCLPLENNARDRKIAG